MRTGSIYKIECTLNQKVYIGQTVQHPPIKRWVDHYKEISNLNNQLYIYRAIRKCGIENFTFQILKTNIALSELNELEEYYINKFNSNKNGFNLTRGGKLTVKSKINENIVKQIINTIKLDEEKTLVEIAHIYGISREMVSDINTGSTWYFDNEIYPIRDNRGIKNKLSESDVYDIYTKLRNQNTLSDIAREYEVSVTNISNINNGIIYKFLSEDSYPIYTPNNSKKRLSIDKVKEVVVLLMNNPEYTYSKIGNIVGVGRKTVSGINNGNLYIDIAKDLGIIKYPIR